MLHPAANRHPKATHQCLLMGVQACRLPALKPLKPLKTLQRLKTLTTRHGDMLHPAANRHPKATHQCLLMGVQACRLPALEPLKHLKPLKTLQRLKTLPWGSKPAVRHASSCSQQAPQGHTSMSSYGRPSLPFASP